MNKPIQQAYNALEDLVGKCPKHCARDCKHDKDDRKDVTTETSFFSFRPKRKGIRNLDTMIVAQLYNNHLKYEFKENELYSLLGEDVDANRDAPKRRYFLKFVSLQIINVDCQSGLVCDTEPISLAISKMIQLFFLSSDQLQHLLSESLRVRKEDGKLKLVLDQDILR